MNVSLLIYFLFWQSYSRSSGSKLNRSSLKPCLLQFTGLFSCYFYRPTSASKVSNQTENNYSQLFLTSFLTFRLFSNHQKTPYHNLLAAICDLYALKEQLNTVDICSDISLCARFLKTLNFQRLCHIFSDFPRKSYKSICF